jgi:hypothetical protein
MRAVIETGFLTLGLIAVTIATMGICWADSEVTRRTGCDELCQTKCHNGGRDADEIRACYVQWGKWNRDGSAARRAIEFDRLHPPGTNIHQ